MAVRGQKESTCRLFPTSLSFLGVWKRKNRVGLIDTNLPWGFLLLSFYFFAPPPRLFPSIHPYFSFASHRKEFWSRDRAHPDSEFRLGFSDTETLACVHLYSPTFERILNYWADRLRSLSKQNWHRQTDRHGLLNDTHKHTNEICNNPLKKQAAKLFPLV